MAIFLVGMGCVNEVDQVLFGAKVGVDVEVVVNVVAMVGTRIVLEDRREPNGSTAESSNIVQLSIQLDA